jgi:metal-dependent amidase/aminoacylase/carboxypeptidase family protein
MRSVGVQVLAKADSVMTASTDMGNVSHEVPSFHGSFAIPTCAEAALHSKLFAAAAGKSEAHEAALQSAKGMAMMALRVIIDEQFAVKVRRDFDQKTR